MTIHPLTQHYGVIRDLPGVVEVKQARTAKGEGIDIHTANAQDAFFLDELVADSIQGRDVRFIHQGPEIGILPPSYYPPDEILRDYGSTMKALPGVSHLGTITVKVGELLPAFDTAIEVVTTQKREAELLDDLLEPQIAGTRILVRSERQNFDQYGRLPAPSLN